MKTQVSLRHDREQQHILLIITTRVSFPYARDELVDKKFGPQCQFNPLAREAHNKFYEP